MGFDWIFLNPIHLPGGSGSLYAVKDYYALNPAFQGKSKKSADKLIGGFLKEAEKRGIRVMMDLVINHTGNDSVLADEHPEWFVREPDGSLAAPFALDPGGSGEKTVWGDLAEIDYSERPERQEIIDYFCRSRPPLHGARLPRLSLRRRLQGAERGLAGHHRRRAQDRRRRGLCVGEPRLDDGAGPGAAWRRLRLPVQQLEMVGLPRRSGCSSSTRCSARSRPPSRFPKPTTPSGWSRTLSPKA